MGIIDFILNLAAVLLWLNWLSSRLDPMAQRKPATLMGTLRPAAPPSPRHRAWLLVILALLTVRAWLYCQLGPSLAPGWTGQVNFGTVILAFSCRGGWLGLERMLLFSFLSFGVMLGVVYLWLILLSLLKGPDAIHRLVRVSLGRVDGWPGWAKILVPWLLVFGGWILLTWLLTSLKIIPRPISPAQRIEQAAVIGCGAFLVWKYVLGALLSLYLLNTYVYLGSSALWKYVNVTADTLLAPLRHLPFGLGEMLRVGKVDFAPVAAVGVIFLSAQLIGNSLIWLYQHLPF